MQQKDMGHRVYTSPFSWEDQIKCGVANCPPQRTNHQSRKWNIDEMAKLRLCK